MADNLHRYGLRFKSGLHGEPQPQLIPMYIASGATFTINSQSVGIEIGDVVEMLSTGYVDLAQGTEGTSGNPLGVVMGFGPMYNSATQRMEPANFYPQGGITWGTNFERQTIVYVCPVFGNIWRADCDDNVTATTLATYLSYIGENVDLVMTTDVTNTLRQKCDPMIDISGHATTNTLHFRIWGIGRDVVGMDYSGKYVTLDLIPNVFNEPPSTILGT